MKERGNMQSQTVYFHLLVLPRDKLISVANDTNKFYQRFTVRPSSKASVLFTAACRRGQWVDTMENDALNPLMIVIITTARIHANVLNSFQEWHKWKEFYDVFTKQENTCFNEKLGFTIVNLDDAKRLLKRSPVHQWALFHI